jgi:hypothetical protein
VAFNGDTRQVEPSKSTMTPVCASGRAACHFDRFRFLDQKTTPLPSATMPRVPSPHG